MSIAAAGSQKAASVIAPYLGLEFRDWVRIGVRVRVRVRVTVRVRDSVRLRARARAVPERRLHAKHLHLEIVHLHLEIGHLHLEIGHLHLEIGHLRLEIGHLKLGALCRRRRLWAFRRCRCRESQRGFDLSVA